MSTLYTTGNWTIETLYADSISTPKTLSLPDFDWAADWHATGRPASRDVPKSTVEAYFGNTSGPYIGDVEHLTINYRNLQNVYDDLPVPVDASNQLRQKNGRSVYRQFVGLYKATNSVSGEEVYLPLKGSVTINLPAAPLVQEPMLRDFKNRIIASLHATGDVGTDLLMEEFRRDLDPTR